MSFSFNWDDDKNITNFKKHEVWFEEARTVWADSRSCEFFDEVHSKSEDRFIRIGFSTKNRLLLVVFCERSSENVIRIISARKATRAERDQYEKGI
ncbi:MAG: BrnT family toxin [Bdellovibrionales bacterium]|nr:BrnT family toxin [Bdellovibrionales bacterium]